MAETQTTETKQTAPIIPPTEPSKAKKVWSTPRVIKSTIDQTEAGAGPGTDGIAAATS